MRALLFKLMAKTLTPRDEASFAAYPLACLQVSSRVQQLISKSFPVLGNANCCSFLSSLYLLHLSLFFDPGNLFFSQLPFEKLTGNR